MSASESEGQFDDLIEEIKDSVFSIEILEESKPAFQLRTEGATKDQYELIQEITESESFKIVQNIQYDKLKYMFLKTIEDEGKSPVYLYISTEVDANSTKRGMFLTAFYSYALIFTFDFKKLNYITAKIISILDQYQAEE